MSRRKEAEEAAIARRAEITRQNQQREAEQREKDYPLC